MLNIMGVIWFFQKTFLFLHRNQNSTPSRRFPMSSLTHVYTDSDKLVANVQNPRYRKPVIYVDFCRCFNFKNKWIW